MYERKTIDIWDLYGHYSGKWCWLLSEYSKAEALQQRNTYDENEPNIYHKITMRREYKNPNSKK